MEFINNLGITTTSGFLGLALFLVGAFMVLAGAGIISIQQITVKQGRATWVVGLLITAIGVAFLYPDLSSRKIDPENTVPIVDANESDVADMEAPAVEQATPTATFSISDTNGALSEWKDIQFVIPGNGLWVEADGSYTAIGDKDTIAWSDDLFAGDIEVSFDIESTNSNSAANVILYGNGGSLAKGNLIFTIASDHQSILADSIYDNGTYLFTSMSSLGFAEEKHSVLISIVNRKASLYLDGEEIASTFLNDSINTSGKIGLLKYWEIDEITFSNIRVRESDSIQ